MKALCILEYLPFENKSAPPGCPGLKTFGTPPFVTYSHYEQIHQIVASRCNFALEAKYN